MTTDSKDDIKVLREYLINNPMELYRDPLRLLIKYMESDEFEIEGLIKGFGLKLENIQGERNRNVRQALMNIYERLEAYKKRKFKTLSISMLNQVLTAYDHGDEEFELTLDEREEYFTVKQILARGWPKSLIKAALTKHDALWSLQRPLYLKQRIFDMEMEQATISKMSRERVYRQALDSKRHARVDAAIANAMDAESLICEPEFTTEATEMWERWWYPFKKININSFDDIKLKELLSVWHSIIYAEIKHGDEYLNIWSYAYAISPDTPSRPIVKSALLEKITAEIRIRFPQYQYPDRFDGFHKLIVERVRELIESSGN